MKKYLRPVIYGAIGSILGYGWYYFIGCSGGTCPLTSHWYITTIYGLIGGVLTALPVRKTA